MPTNAATATTSPTNGNAPGPPGASDTSSAIDATGAGTNAPSPWTTTPGCWITTAGHGSSNASGMSTNTKSAATRRRPVPRYPGTTTNPASAYASSSRCTSGENAPMTASPNAEDAAVDSHAEELVRDRPSSAMIPAVTGGTNRCATTTSSRPCATAAVAGGSNAYAAATSARTHRCTGSRRVAT
jgi:hypothetical protein